MEEKLKEIIEYYSSQPQPASQENLVAMLREIQGLLGCIPLGVQERAAAELKVKPSVLACIVKLYPSLKQAPYRHEILACTGARCGAKQAGEILQTLRRELGIGKDGISADGTVLLRTQNCLKHCPTAPNLYLDGVLHTRLTPKSAAELARSLTKEK